ncbi:hypothetical protein D7X74_37805 [Corallococcus sp. CA047B]|uniref:hypothetical protein n=1 Tax=Corallococcus sp. CA047B TaxID=2316729 RepID=UPI000EA0443D|nr:hypothetical protein [Corallococcus sp. CA047B]RKH01478.1 hypothetical protein D7X74_37805 [Corallococcus sp. CA047B]
MSKSRGARAAPRSTEKKTSTELSSARAEVAILRQQMSTVRALLCGVAEAFDRTPTGQVMDGLLLQVEAVTKGGAR